MQVTETQKEGLKRAYTINLPAEELEAKVVERLEEVRPQVEMKGFRKGKVPMPLLRKRFGPRILGEAMQEAIDEAMRRHFEETGDRPAAQPKVEMKDAENWKEGDDVLVELSYEALPEIPEIDFKALRLERLVTRAAEADIDEALSNLAESAKDYKARRKGSKAREGDQVVIDFVGRIDGEAFEGGSAEDYPLVLGSGSFIPGFEEQLVGAKAGETRDVTVQFPEEYGAAQLAGKEAVFEVTVKEVREPVAAEINDELAQKFGVESLEELRKQIAQRLEGEYAQAARAVMKRALLDQLDEAVSFELPPGLVEAEAKAIAHQLWHEEHPDHQGHDHPEIEPTEEHVRLAERRVKLGLLLAEIGSKAGIEVTDAELGQAVMAEARRYPGQEQQFFEFVRQNPNMQQQLRAPIFEDKVIDYIAELAEVVEKEVSKDELKAAVDALEEE